MNFEIGEKYPLSIFTNNRLNISWNTIKVGWDLQILTSKEISKFALDYSEQYPGLINEYISELVFGVDDYKIDEYLKKIFYSLKLNISEKNSPTWNQEWRKWRYCIISEMCKKIKNHEELLVKIDWLGATFGYPSDMKSFIYYLPSENYLKDSKFSNTYERLTQNIYKFLEEEWLNIQKGCNTLPLKIN